MFRAAAVPSPREVKDRAHALSLKGRFDAAAKLIHQHLQRDAGDPSLWLQHAELSRKLRRNDLAVSSYRQAAQRLFQAGHASRARAVLVCAKQLAPKDPAVLADLSRIADDARPPSPLRVAAFAAVPVAEEPQEKPLPALDESLFAPPPPPRERRAPSRPLRVAVPVADESLFAPPPPLPYERACARRSDRRRPQLVIVEDSDLILEDEELLDDADVFFDDGEDTPTDPFFPVVRRA